MTERKTCHCPYCDEPVPDVPCKPCEVTVIRCPACNRPFPQDAKECPDCGAPRPEDKE